MIALHVIAPAYTCCFVLPNLRKHERIGSGFWWVKWLKQWKYHSCMDYCRHATKPSHLSAVAEIQQQGAYNVRLKGPINIAMLLSPNISQDPCQRCGPQETQPFDACRADDAGRTGPKQCTLGAQATGGSCTSKVCPVGHGGGGSGRS